MLLSQYNKTNSLNNSQELPAFAADVICESDWRLLRSISNGKRDDCKYVRTLLNVLYRNESDKIPFRCLAGISEGIVSRNGEKYFREKKNAMSPDKRVFINKLFRSRIHALEVTANERISRVGQQYVNRLIKSSFITLQKSQASLNAAMDQHMSGEE